MQKAIAIAIVSGFSLFSISAEALPIASAVSGPNPMITQVAQGYGYQRASWPLRPLPSALLLPARLASRPLWRALLRNRY